MSNGFRAITADWLNSQKQYNAKSCLGLHETLKSTPILHIHNHRTHWIDFLISDIEQEQPGGALFVQTMCNASITNCHFSGNQAADDGGAIFIKIAGNLIVSNSWFEENNTQDSGGSIAVVDSSVSISFSHFLLESVSHGLAGSICLLNAGVINIKHSELKKLQCQ